MPEMTQKDLLERLLAEIASIKHHMPNGELVSMAEDMKKMKEDISDLKYTLLNPENGVIVKTNKNTEFRLENEDRVYDIDELMKWKNTVSKALWIFFSALVGVIVKLLSMGS